MEELDSVPGSVESTPLDPEQLREFRERFRPKRVSTLQALRKIVRASDLLDQETLTQLDSGVSVRFKTTGQPKG